MAIFSSQCRMHLRLVLPESYGLMCHLPSWRSPGWNQSSLSPVRPVAFQPSQPGSEPNEVGRWTWRAWLALQVLCADHIHPSKQQFPKRVKKGTFNHNSIKVCGLSDVIFTLTEHCCQLVYTWWSVNQHKHVLQRQVVTENTGVLLRWEGRRHLEKLPSVVCDFWLTRWEECISETENTTWTCARIETHCHRTAQRDIQPMLATDSEGWWNNFRVRPLLRKHICALAHYDWSHCSLWMLSFFAIDFTGT